MNKLDKKHIDSCKKIIAFNGICKAIDCRDCPLIKPISCDRSWDDSKLENERYVKAAQKCLIRLNEKIKIEKPIIPIPDEKNGVDVNDRLLFILE